VRPPFGFWLIRGKQTNRTVCLSDAAGNLTASPVVAGVERARWNNLNMKPISRSEFSPKVDRLEGDCRKAFILGQDRHFLMAFPMASKPSTTLADLLEVAHGRAIFGSAGIAAGVE
jgi:hypothetical protein